MRPWKGFLLIAAICAAVSAPASPAAAEDLWGVTDDQRLIRIDLDSPQTLVGEPLPLGGLVEGKDVHGLATWASGLYALTAEGELFRLDPTSGRGEVELGPCSEPAAAPVAMATDPSGHGLTTVAPSDVWTRFDLPCGIRENGTIAYDGGAPADPQLVGTTFSGGDQWAVDAGTDRLVKRAENATEWSDVGPLGIDVEAPAALERAFFELRLASGGTLYTVSEGTGAVTAIGPIDSGHVVRDMAAVTHPEAVFGSGGEFPPGEGLSEGQTKQTVVIREGDPLPAFSVGYSFEASPQSTPTSTPGEDFVPQCGVLEFAPGQRRATLTLPNIDDDRVEGVVETFVMRLRPDLGCGDASQTGFMPVSIFDDDVAAAVKQLSVPESVGTIDLPGDRDTPLREAAELGLELAPSGGGTAAAGDDFAVPQPVVLPAKATSGTLQLPIVDDRVAEPTESIVLQRATRAPFSRMTERYVVEIVDDDGPPVAGPPLPAPPPLVDTLAPRLRLFGGRSLRVSRRRAALRFTCSEACALAGSLKRGRLTLARGTASAPGTAARTLRLRMTRRGLARLRRARRLRVTLVLTVRDAAGNVRRSRRPVTLVLRRR
jgi:hypothetical protein